MKILILCTAVFATIGIIMYFLDNTARYEKFISKKIGIKSLGNIPYNAKNKYLLVENNKKANIMKYIRDIRANIISSTDQKVFAFISCNSSEGKSWVANNIAMSLARIDKKVLLIDANLKKESNIGQVFYTESGEGLSNFIKEIELGNKLGNLQKARKYIKHTQIPYLHIMQNGTDFTNTNRLFKSKEFKELLELCKEMYDYIILDGIAFKENDDCLDICSAVDSNIIVIEKNKTKYNDLLNLIEDIEDRNGIILGYILNKTSLKFGKYYGKRLKHRYGMYIETTEKSEEDYISVDNIISSTEENLIQKETDDFETLHQEIKEKILIEDFINDIQVNFNMKFDNIEKSEKENADYLIGVMVQHNKKVNEEIEKYNKKIAEEIKNYEKSTKDIMHILEEVQSQIKILKNENEIKKKYDIKQIMDGIKNQIFNNQFEQINKKIELLNYNKQIAELKDKIDNIDYDKKIQEISQKIDNLNYYEKIEELKEKINNINFDEKIEEVSEKIDNISYDKEIAELKEKIDSINYDEKIEELKEKIDNINYDEKIEELKEKIDNVNYDEKIEEINKKIENMNYDEKFEEIFEEIENINYDEKIDEIMEEIENINYDSEIEEIIDRIESINYDEQLEEIKELIEKVDYESQINEIRDKLSEVERKNEDESRNNNIINLGRLFIENSKKNKNVFSIDEPISYYDLERLATDIIILDDTNDTIVFNDIKDGVK